MTETPPAIDAPEIGQYLQVWTENLAGVLGQVAGAAFPVQALAAVPAEAPSREEHDLHMVIAASGSVRGEMSLRIPRTAVLGLGQLFMSEPQDAAAELKSDHRDAVGELLRQVAGQAATAMASQWGEVQLRAEAGPPPTWSAGATGWLGSTAEAPYRFLMEWQLSAALVAALRPQPQTAPAASGGSPSPVEVLPSSAQDGRMEFLMDVKLGVTLRFGQKNLRLREILALDAGSIIELDRQIQDPADLLLDGKLIARGEVVVVDGNYGLRILEVVSSRLPG
jgi:flagellar motor switch protein FliN/FliY